MELNFIQLNPCIYVIFMMNYFFMAKNIKKIYASLVYVSKKFKSANSSAQENAKKIMKIYAKQNK